MKKALATEKKVGLFGPKTYPKLEKFEKEVEI